MPLFNLKKENMEKKFNLERDRFLFFEKCVRSCISKIAKVEWCQRIHETCMCVHLKVTEYVSFRFDDAFAYMDSFGYKNSFVAVDLSSDGKLLVKLFFVDLKDR